MVDAFLEHDVGSLCRVLVSDGEGCNLMIRRAILGQLNAAEMKRVERLNWFSRLKHAQVPGVDGWPRFPIKLCTIGNENVYFLSGPAHSIKNSCGQAASSIRVLYCGSYFVDGAGMLENHVPLPAYARVDPMSDRLSALFNCPMFLICPDSRQQRRQT